MSKVRTDATGLYVIAGGYVARPGVTREYAHVVAVQGDRFRMDDGGLKSGDTVKAAHRAQTSLVRLRMEDGTVLFWHGEWKGAGR